MAGSTTRGYIREVKYPGPGSFTWVQGTPVQIDGATGYLPPLSGPNTNPNNTGNPMIDPTTGKKWSTT